MFIYKGIYNATTKKKNYLSVVSAIIGICR